MNNLEKYHDKIVNDFHGVNKKTEQVTPCQDLICADCMFGTSGQCKTSPLIWLNKNILFNKFKNIPFFYFYS